MELRFGQLSDAERSRERPAEEMPFRIAIFGDFTGRANRNVSANSDELARAKPLKAQFETLEDLLAQLTPQLAITLSDGSRAEVKFTEFDDFHSDGVYRQVDAVQGLRADEAAPLMRSILHAPDFRTVESNWRGVEWLLRRTNKSTKVLVRLFDCSAAEFTGDLRSNDELSQTGIYRALKANDEGQELPWAAVAALFQFDMTSEQSELLGRLAMIGYQLNAPILTNLDARVVAADFSPDADTKTAWEALTALPASAFLQLATPRFLLRLPYGANYKPTDAFDFEEFTGHGEYLWGHPALLSACLLARDYIKSGWQFTPGEQLQLDSMPIHAYRTADDDEVAVSTESRFSSTVGEQLAAWRLSAVLPVRGRDLVELSALRSVSNQTPTLAGAWNAGGGVRLDEPSMTGNDGATSRSGGEGVDAELAALLADAKTNTAEADAVDNDAIDAELAALLAGDDPPPVADNIQSELDAELAALLGGSDSSPPMETSPTDDAMGDAGLDAELAALLGETAAPPTDLDSTAQNADSPTVHEDLDAELVALMGDSAPAETTPESVSDLDAELAALMGDMVPPEPATDTGADLDAELAALMADTDAPVESNTEEFALDNELAALLGDTPSGETTGGLDTTEAQLASNDGSGVDTGDMDPELAALLGDISTGDTSGNGNAAFHSTDQNQVNVPSPAEEPPPAARKFSVPTTNAIATPTNSMSAMSTELADIDELIQQAQQASNYGQGGSPPLLDFQALLQPISDENPAGDSVPFPLREELEQARKEINPESFRADDPMRPTDWVRADWSKVISLTQEILTERSKNLLVAARLLEALTKKHGFAGARDGLHLMRLMVEVCWDRLEPPIEDDDLEVRAGPFNWLDDADRGSCYPFTIKQAPLIYAGGETFSWMQWNTGGSATRGPEDIEKAIAMTTREQCQRVADDVSQALSELKWLVQSLRHRMGPDAPGLAAIRPAIDECRALAMQILAKKGPAPVDASTESASGDESASGGGPNGAPRLNSRATIYAQLAEAAEALQRLEPHSPVPFLILRAVELGSLPFPQLMAALIRDSSVLSEMKRELGIKADE